MCVDLSGVVTGIRDVAVAGAALVAAVVAVRGLKAWSEELRGQSRFRCRARPHPGDVQTARRDSIVQVAAYPRRGVSAWLSNA